MIMRTGHFNGALSPFFIPFFAEEITFTTFLWRKVPKELPLPTPLRRRGCNRSFSSLFHYGLHP